MNLREKNGTSNCFHIMLRSYDGTELRQLVEIYKLSLIAKITDHINHSGLYCDDGLILLRNYQWAKNRLNFKDVGFKTDTKANMKIVIFGT